MDQRAKEMAEKAGLNPANPPSGCCGAFPMKYGRGAIVMDEKRLILFTDSGDTIIDETTQVYENGIVQRADCIENAGEVLRQLYSEGFRICLVADGETASFDNVYRENGLGDCFHTRTISEQVGVQKPDARMFEDAMAKNGLTESDKHRIVMIGNNCPKDIAGANRFGITSILIDWSKRYRVVPEHEDEKPDYIIHRPCELPDLIHMLEERLPDAPSGLL